MQLSHLLDEIAAHPSDIDRWLVLADWLEERGDPRGELVRLRHVLTQAIDLPERTALEKRLCELVKSGVEPLTPQLVNSVGMRLALIPAGEFLMGSPESEADHWDNEAQHPVKLSQAFYVGVHAVTQGQWQAVMGTAPWSGNAAMKEGYNYRATLASWEEAVKFCEELTKRDRSGQSYRLPSEAQWEYACRGGTRTAYSFGDDAAKLGEHAWFEGNARFKKADHGKFEWNG